jgi:hypothetical protein
MCDSEEIRTRMRSKAPYSSLASYDVSSFKTLVDNFSDLIDIGCKGKDINKSNVNEKKELFAANSNGCFTYGSYTHGNVGAKKLTSTNKYHSYENKYFKYKAKYINLKNIFEYYNIIGGGTVPSVQPATQSWIYMPLLLMPFTDVQVEFPSSFNDVLESAAKISGSQYNTFEKISDKLKETYTSKGISDFSDRGNITRISGIMYDDGSSRLHLRGEDQVKLLELAGLDLLAETLTPLLINNLAGTRFTFEQVRR